MDVFIGRQPIFNKEEKVIAYELLYRGQNIESSIIQEADDATIDVLVNSLLNIGFYRVANGKPCFVNFTKNLLLSRIEDYLNPTQIVIEILEDVPITPAIIHRLKELKALGFKIALDDFILDENFEIYDELFALIDYLKVDFLLSPIEECIKTSHIVKDKYPQVILLAEKVETCHQVETAKSAGYEMFQGYFFEKPQIVTSVDIPSSKMQYFEIMSLLNDEQPNINELSILIERDISLSYKILQQTNATMHESKQPIYSIKQAITRVGFIELRKWIYLLALQGNRNVPDMDSYLELIRSSLFRAKVCESLAKVTQKVNYAECFLMGMFSLIDILLQKPLTTILQQLPLSNMISATLLGEETEFTIYLEMSVALDKMDWAQVNNQLTQLNISSVELKQLHREALEWSDSVILK